MNYTLLKDLKYSGLFRISLAASRETGQRVVVKSPLPSIDDPREANSLLLREADFLKSISHRQIPAFIELFEFNGRNFLVIEYFMGCSLSDIIKKFAETKTAHLWQDAAFIMLETSRCLDYLHREALRVPILHRDVTPQNILITVNGGVKLIDFGISREDDDRITDPGLLKGKAGYMAPELIRHGRYSTATDIFALGVTIMEFLLLEHIFGGKDFQDTLRNILEGSLPRRERFAHVAGDFVSLLFASVSPEPSNRPDAAQLVERLERINAGWSLSAGLIQEVRTLAELVLKEKKMMSAEELGEETTDRLGYDDITRISKIE